VRALALALLAALLVGCCGTHPGASAAASNDGDGLGVALMRPRGTMGDERSAAAE
jgi:hypothetical protein